MKRKTLRSTKEAKVNLGPAEFTPTELKQQKDCLTAFLPRFTHELILFPPTPTSVFPTTSITQNPLDTLVSLILEPTYGSGLAMAILQQDPPRFADLIRRYTLLWLNEEGKHISLAQAVNPLSVDEADRLLLIRKLGLLGAIYTALALDAQNGRFEELPLLLNHPDFNRFIELHLSPEEKVDVARQDYDAYKLSSDEKQHALPFYLQDRKLVERVSDEHMVRASPRLASPELVQDFIDELVAPMTTQEEKSALGALSRIRGGDVSADQAAEACEYALNPENALTVDPLDLIDAHCARWIAQHTPCLNEYSTSTLYGPESLMEARSAAKFYPKLTQWQAIQQEVSRKKTRV